MVVWKHNDIQESIPVGCVPPACADYNSFNSHQMSLWWPLYSGGLMTKFEQVSSDGHQMSLAEGSLV